MPSLVKCLQLQLFELENENEVQCLTSADSNISRPSSSGGTNHKYLRLIMVIFVTGLLVLAFCSSGVFIGRKTDTYVVTDQDWEQKEGIDDVSWVHDELWFSNEVARGCCPFAKDIYTSRYEEINYRCCTDRISEGKIDSLRAIGGADYSYINRNLAILFQGDSLTEQHFLGMFCFAWSTNLTIQLQQAQGIKRGRGSIWNGRIGLGNGSFVHLQYLRWDHPDIPGDDVYNKLQNPDFLILGGWHHGPESIDVNRIVLFLQQVHHRWSNSKIIVRNQLPDHFPGGSYSKNRSTSAPCELKNGTTTNVIVDALTLTLVRNQTGAQILDANKLYFDRGNAHIGHRGDCRHWCIAPGVLDGLARMTLAAISHKSDLNGNR